MKRKSLSTLGLGAMLFLIAGVGALALDSGQSALTKGQCQKVQGTLVLLVTPLTDSSGTLTGTAKGEFNGTVDGSQEDGTDGRFSAEFVVTSKAGVLTALHMDYLAGNFTTPNLLGAGLMGTQGSPDPGDTYYVLTATMAPGFNVPMMEWSYSGLACVATE